MPFPLAHPAAVLPLKRFCPRWLSLPALVIGSVCPDVAYLFGRLKLDEVSHTPLGILTFCLPAGLVLLGILYLVRPYLLRIMPEHFRPFFLTETRQSMGSVVAIVGSLLLGSASHALWDSFTHLRGAGVEHFPVLATVIGSFAGHNVRFCRLLWYGSSLLGVACVYVAYRTSQTACLSAPGECRRRRTWVEAALVGILVLPIELVHDLVRNPAGGVVVALLSGVLVAAVVWNQARAGRKKLRPGA